MSLLIKIRNKLLKLLAGDATVILNANIVGEVVHLDIDKSRSLIANSHFSAAKVSDTVLTVSGPLSDIVIEGNTITGASSENGNGVLGG
jgi:hypothetical protein